MKKEVLLYAEQNHTLPDEYFQARLSYSTHELEEIQDEALPQAFAHAFDNSTFYRSKFSSAGLTPDSVRGLNDLRRLPFTTSKEIRSNPAQGRTCSDIMTVDQRQICLIHRSSGTTGSPKVLPYTGRDTARWAANVATIFWIAGLRKSDIAIPVAGFGAFTGGGGGYLGSIALGITCIPVSIGPGLSDKLMAFLTGRMDVNGKEVMIDPLLRANAVICLASFLPRLEELLDEYEVSPKELSLTKITCGAEPSSDALRHRFATRFGIVPRDNYGLGEFYGPGVAGECDAGGGLHVLSDDYIAEVVDPETGEPTPDGEMGELVLTSLRKDAMPLFRYRTGDRLMALPTNCPCGMGHTRVSRVSGRIDTDDIMLPGGVIISRTYLEDTILSVDGIGTEYIVTVAEHPSRRGLKRLYLAIEGDIGIDLAKVITHRMQVEYNCTPVVTVLPKGTIPRSPGKATRIYGPEEYKALVKSSLRLTETQNTNLRISAGR
jgi:phenylacetate-CoA ligase